MTITHDACRATVAAGDAHTDAEVGHHLDTCESCRMFAARVADLDARAVRLAPPSAPTGLADRVVAALPAHDIGARRLPPRLQTYLAIAAALALVAGVASSLVGNDDRGGGEARQALLVAATRFEEGGPARVEVEASSEVAVSGEGRNTDFSEVPPEVRDHMAAQWDRMMAELERQVDEMFATVERQLNDFERQTRDMFGGGGGEPSSDPPPPEEPERAPEPEPDGRQRPTPPERASLALQVRASGVVAPGGGVQLDGSVAAVPGTIAVPSQSATFAVDATPTGGAVRAGAGGWVTADAGTGPLGRVLLDSRAIPAILRAATGEIATSQAGEGVRRYRFRIPAAAVGGGAESWLVTARIDASGRIRQLALAPAGAVDQATRTQVTLEIGSRATLDDRRRPATVSGEARAASPFSAIAPAVRAALHGGAR